MRKAILLIGALVCFLSTTTEALQMILSTREPMCISVTPRKVGVKIEIDYTVTGVNEKNVKFTVGHKDWHLAYSDSLSLTLTYS